MGSWSPTLNSFLASFIKPSLRSKKKKKKTEYSLLSTFYSTDRFGSSLCFGRVLCLLPSSLSEFYFRSHILFYLTLISQEAKFPYLNLGWGAHLLFDQRPETTKILIINSNGVLTITQEAKGSLRDVVSVSGVNLWEEQERMLLFPTPNKDQPPPRKLREDEHEAMVVEKNALRRKVAGVVGRCGLIVVGRDVERCLALCVEECMRGILCGLIRESKQRIDWEESRHCCAVSTSDVRMEIMALNERAREEEVQAAEGRKEVACEGSKSGKHDEGVDRMRRSTAAAANVAACASLGGIDILAKWKLKVDKLAQEKREGKEVDPKAALTVGTEKNDNVNADKRSGVQAGSVSATGSAVGKFRKNGEAMAMSERKVASTRSIRVKDVIAVLEKEPQMSRSTLMYLLMNPAASQ